MAIEQVNLQELQRLNDAILLTYEAIRRVAPQLQMLSQLQGQFGVGGPMVNPWQQQQYGIGYGMNPWQQQQLPFGQQHLGLFGMGHPGIGQGLFGQQGIGQGLFGQQGIGQGLFGQQPFGGIGQQYGVPQLGQFGIGQSPFGQGQVPFQGLPFQTSPYQQYGQRF
jgi:hypothetical protein